MKNMTTKVGVAQVLNRLSYQGSLSHLRRVNTPIDKTSKLIQPRKLPPTSWGYICPCETPEGGAIGVVKNLAITSVEVSNHPVKDMGKRRIDVDGNFYIAGEDVENIKEGEQIRLLGLGNILITKQGEEFEGEYVKDGDIKDISKIQWVSQKTGHKIKMIIPKILFKTDIAKGPVALTIAFDFKTSPLSKKIDQLSSPLTVLIIFVFV